MNGTRTELACLRSVMPIADTFRAWRIFENGENHPLAINASDLAEAVMQAAPECPHKGKFVVCHVDALKGRTTLHFYTIRQKQAIWRHNPQTRQAERFTPRTAEHLLSQGVKSFDPVEPFRWSPGCNVVGVDSSIVEGRSA